MSTPSFSLSSFPLSISSEPENKISGTSTQLPRMNQLKKSPYQAAQQVKLLYLEAEIESLLQRLKILKQKRTAAEGVGSRE